MTAVLSFFVNFFLPVRETNKCGWRFSCEKCNSQWPPCTLILLRLNFQEQTSSQMKLWSVLFLKCSDNPAPNPSPSFGRADGHLWSYHGFVLGFVFLFFFPRLIKIITRFRNNPSFSVHEVVSKRKKAAFVKHNICQCNISLYILIATLILLWSNFYQMLGMMRSSCLCYILLDYSDWHLEE